ncbi:MAG: hypothetical protein HC784_12115 [Hydrococcus sp. CSU_1_8]|nr:hypothetical protein [Hydrococcus sp. CSU_1_8]
MTRKPRHIKRRPRRQATLCRGSSCSIKIKVTRQLQQQQTAEAVDE